MMGNLYHYRDVYFMHNRNVAIDSFIKDIIRTIYIILAVK